MKTRKDIKKSLETNNKNTPVGTKTIEVEDITVDKAIRKALKQLKAKKKEVTVEVLKEEHKGLFGMEGAEPAKIRVTLKEQAY